MSDEAKAIDAASDETARLIRERSEEIGELRQRCQQAETNGAAWKARADERDKEINSLRAQLLDALLVAERLRGFYDATEAAKPPRMVEQQRDPPEMPTFSPHGYSDYASGRSNVSKPWYAR
jgi:chromosome segregation ATPase